MMPPAKVKTIQNMQILFRTVPLWKVGDPLDDLKVINSFGGCSEEFHNFTKLKGFDAEKPPKFFKFEPFKSFLFQF